MKLTYALALAVLGSTAVVSVPAEGAPLQRTVAFVLDQWVDIGFVDGPVTIHRLRIERKSGLKGFKSVLTRPGNSQFLQDVQIQIECSNTSTADWEVAAKIAWVDSGDAVIDGYEGREEVGEGESHELATMLFSTLKYGLDQARRLRVELEIVPD
jgi:hypothetical protein